MKYGSVPGVERPVSRLVMGSMVFSTREARSDVCAAGPIRRGRRHGGRHGRVYALGTSEEAFGRWVQARGCRDQMVVIGKGAHHDRDTFERRVNPAAIHEDVQTSLDAMQLDRWTCTCCTRTTRTRRSARLSRR